MIYDLKTSVELMKERGYNHTASNGAKNVLFFLKQYQDENIHIHATVRLEKQSIDLDSTGILDLGMSLECINIPLENVKFEDFENKFYHYLYLCIYGKHIHPVQDDSNNGLYFKSETASKTNSGGELPGGDEKAEGKAKKPNDIDERKKKFWENVKGVAKQKGYPKELAIEFYKYWAENNKSGTKFRQEKETFFDIPRRFTTWITNDKKWSGKNFVAEKAEKQEEELKSRKQTLNHKKLF